MPVRIKLPESKILKMYRRGVSSTEIAKQMKCSPPTIRRCLDRNGEPRRTLSDAAKRSFEQGRKVTKFWAGKKQPAEMVESRLSKIRGENHYLWKGGNSLRPYRKLVKKTKCDRCESKKDLGIHHRDDDHYNNDLSNLVVLCLSCHMSIHKTAYWKAWRAGKPLPKSNGSVGWLRKKKSQ